VSGKRISYTWLALGYAILILIVSSIPDLSPPQLGFRFQDKLYHFLEYAVFSILLFFALFNSPRNFLRKNFLIIAILIGLVFAAIDEIHQSLIPGRSADVKDFLADFLGLFFVQLFFWFYYRKRSITR
jgi:VanZ family protein